MEPWPLLLATLYWRGQPLPLEEFMVLSQRQGAMCQPQNLWKIVQSKKLRKYLHDYPEWWRKGEQEINWCYRNQVHLLTPLDPAYPSCFLNLAHPPLLLSYSGEPCWMSEPSLSIVGSRQPMSSSIAWMEEELVPFLCERSLILTSGGARGIDQKAHALSMRVGRPTLCMVPSGLAHIYPQSLRSWSEAIRSGGGALMSQFSPFARLFKSNFHLRNALIAALSPITFVVEARRRSGSLLTANLSRDQGHTVCTLPCSPKESAGMGSLDLLCDGGIMVRDRWDLLALWDREVQRDAKATIVASGPS